MNHTTLKIIYTNFWSHPIRSLGLFFMMDVENVISIVFVDNPANIAKQDIGNGLTNKMTYSELKKALGSNFAKAAPVSEDSDFTGYCSTAVAGDYWYVFGWNADPEKVDAVPDYLYFKKIEEDSSDDTVEIEQIETLSYKAESDAICALVGIPARSGDVVITRERTTQLTDDTGSEGTYVETYTLEGSETPFLTESGHVLLTNDGGTSGVRFESSNGTEFLLSLEGNDPSDSGLLVKEIRNGSGELDGRKVGWKLLETLGGLQIINITFYYENSDATEDMYYLCTNNFLVLIFTEVSL